MTAVIAFGAMGYGCGKITAGTGVFTDPIPSGTLVAQGQFYGRSGQSASGGAEVYNTAAGSYTVHLDGVTLPQLNSLQLIFTINGTAQTGIELRGSSGSQNYVVQSQTGSIFNSVRVFSPPLQEDVAEADF